MQVASKLRKWEMESIVGLVIYGAEGYIPKNFKNHHERFGTNFTEISLARKCKYFPKGALCLR